MIFFSCENCVVSVTKKRERRRLRIGKSNNRSNFGWRSEHSTKGKYFREKSAQAKLVFSSLLSVTSESQFYFGFFFFSCQSVKNSSHLGIIIQSFSFLDINNCTIFLSTLFNPGVWATNKSFVEIGIRQNASESVCECLYMDFWHWHISAYPKHSCSSHPTPPFYAFYHHVLWRWWYTTFFFPRRIHIQIAVIH